MSARISDLFRRAVSEACGSALLLAAVVGSGIMGERLSAGNVALALLANTVATAGALVPLILALGEVSGAHFNPAVTLVDAWQGGLPWRSVPAYIAAQLGGALAGVMAAHVMFGARIFSVSGHARAGPTQLLSEFIATAGLITVIRGCARRRSSYTALAVGAYIASAYWFTASTSFANPTVTLARSLSDTFAGIRPIDIPGFLLAQLAGAAAAAGLTRWLFAALPQVPALTEIELSDGARRVS